MPLTQNSFLREKMFLEPTLSAMPPPLFQRYVEKFHKMRPKFILFVQNSKRAGFQIKQGMSIRMMFPTASSSLSLLRPYFPPPILGLSEAEYHVEPVLENLSDAQRTKLEDDSWGG